MVTPATFALLTVIARTHLRPPTRRCTRMCTCAPKRDGARAHTHTDTKANACTHAQVLTIFFCSATHIDLTNMAQATSDPPWPHVRPPCRPCSREHGLADPWRPLDAASALHDVVGQGFYAGADSLAQLNGRTLLCQEVHVRIPLEMRSQQHRTLIDSLTHSLTPSPTD